MKKYNYSFEDIIIYDTTNKLTEEEILKLKKNLAKDINEAFNSYEEC